MTSKPKGFSLIEVSMVLAISVVMMGVVGGVYSQRSSIASDDAAQQVASIVQTVQNEAKQGQGPSSASDITTSATLWGNAVQFSNNCLPSAKPCFIVYRLVKTATASPSIRSYDSYQIATPENFEFDYPEQNEANKKVVVFKNSTGQAYVFEDSSSPFNTSDPTDAETISSYTTNNSTTIYTARSPYASAKAQYSLTVSTNDISIKRK